MLSLMAREGLRACEVATLDIGDVDLRDATLFVREGKGGNQRLLPLTSGTRVLIEEYAATERGPRAGRLLLGRWPTLSTNDGGLDRRTVAKIVGLAMKRAGVAESGHALRHTAAYAVIDAGARVQDLQEFLGHRDLSTTSVYTKRSRVEDLRQYVGKTEYRGDMLDDEQRGKTG